jgi:hypothetical protein
MPYPAADRIVSFSELHGERMQELGWVSIPNFVDWRDAATQFETMSLFRGRSMALTGDGDPLYM